MDLMAPRYEAPGHLVGASAAVHIRSVEVLVEVDYAHLFPNPWYAELLRCGLPPVRRRRVRLPRPFSPRRPKAAHRNQPTPAVPIGFNPGPPTPASPLRPSR